MADAAADTHQFGNVVLSGKDQHREESIGTLRMHAQGFGWKSRKAGTVIAISKADLRGIDWIKIPHAYQLKLRAKGGFVYRFNGLKSQDKSLIKSYCSSNFTLEPTDAQLSWRGWNWGEAAVEGSSLSFTVEGEQAFEIPLGDVTQASAVKNETVVEMADDDTALPEDESVVELRLQMPNAAADDETLAGETPASMLVADIKANAELEQAGTALAAFEDVPVQVPRGRYDIEMFDKYMKLHGKTYDYKVLYTNVSGIFVLPKPDMYHMALCLSLTNPLRQGATTYPHVVMQLPRDAQLEVTLSMSEEEVSRRFGDKLEQTEDGDMSEVIAKVVSAFTKKKVQGLKAGGFNDKPDKDERHKSLKCSLKAQDGQLYPLDKCFFFVSTKPMMLEFERIASIEFNRVDKQSSASAARTFDITMHMKDGSGNVQFVNLQRADYQELFRFLSAKKIRIQNIASASKVNFDEEGDDGDDEDDPYMNRVKRQREEKGDDDDDDDDEDSEEDVDFAPGEDSDVAEEYDEGEEKDEERAGKNKKKAAESDESDDDDDDDSEEEKPKKKAPPAKKAKSEKAPAAKKGASSSEGGKKRKAKPKKDPNAPKKNANAYMLWFNASREQIKGDNPDAATKDLAKIAGGMWKEMNPAARAPWDDMAKKDKERFVKEKAEYDAANKKAAAPAGSASDSDDDSDDE